MQLSLKAKPPTIVAAFFAVRLGLVGIGADDMGWTFLEVETFLGDGVLIVMTVDEDFAVPLTALFVG